MASPPDSGHCVLTQPLAYLHPERLSIPVGLDSPALRAALNPVLHEALGGGAVGAGSAQLDWWLCHWLRLRAAVPWMGGYLLWPELARGGALLGLSAAQRRFATFELGPRAVPPCWPDAPLALRLETISLSALQNATRGLPNLVQERLPLLFSPAANALVAQAPPVVADFRLIVQAVHHARYCKKPG